jgi:tetrahydromethanopterin S-methyltransferase subunit G
MGDAAMELNEQQLNQLADMITTRFRTERPEIGQAGSGHYAVELPARPVVDLPPEFWELQAEFRAEVREGRVRFEAIEKRFEAIDRRFEAVDKRFEAIDKRFEAIDKRFDDLIHYMDKRFGDLIHYMDKRFEAVDKRFSSVQWAMGVGFTVVLAMMSVYQFVR